MSMKTLVRTVLGHLREGIKPDSARHMERLAREIRQGTARAFVANHAEVARHLVAEEARDARRLVAKDAEAARTLVGKDAEAARTLVAKDAEAARTLVAEEQEQEQEREPAGKDPSGSFPALHA